MAQKEATLILKIKETGSKALSSISSGISNIASVTKKVVIGMAAAAASVVAFVAKADEFKEVEKSFRSLAASQNQDADAMLNKMRELSKGTISDLKLMQQANQALLLGLPVDKFGEMLTIARSASKATGQSMEFMLQSIVTGLGRGSKLILDNLGIMIDTNQAYEKYAQVLGKTAAQLTEAEKKQAFINEAMRVGLDNASKLGDSNLTLSERVERTKVAFQNMIPVIGEGLRPVLNSLLPIVDRVTESLGSAAQSDSFTSFLQNGTKGIVLFKGAISLLGDVAGAVLGNLSGALSQLVEGKFTQAVETATSTAQAAYEAALASGSATALELDKVDANFAAARAERRQAEINDIALKNEEKNIMAEEQNAMEAMAQEIKNQEKLVREESYQQAMAQLKNDKQMESINKELANETNRVKRLDLLKQKEALINQKARDIEIEQKTKMAQFEAFINSEKVKNTQSTLASISSLQNAKSKELVFLGKAAAIADITISTAQGVMRAFALGPILGPILAPIVAAAGAVNAAKIAGVQLAEGGIVSATPGGIQATIGEGGRDEAVVPLPDDFDPDKGLSGGSTVVNIYGGVLGDEASARELAIAIDQQLFKLKQNNESISFDGYVV